MNTTQSNPLSTENRTKRVNNHVFVDHYIYTGKYKTPTKIQLTTYDTDNIETWQIATDTTSFAEHVREGRINWFDIVGLTDFEAINRILDEFGFDAIDGKDVLTPNHVVSEIFFDYRVGIIPSPDSRVVRPCTEIK